MSGSDMGYVYIARPIGTTGVYKIGATNNLAVRIKRYRVPMEYLACTLFKDYFAAESYFHRMFAKYSFSGEWYAIPDDVINKYIAGVNLLCQAK